MIAYAARTTNQRNRAALKRAGWRILLGPMQSLSHFGMPYALDNGAWTAHASGEEWVAAPFQKMVTRLGQNADWVALPDIVEGGMASLARSLEWLHYVLTKTNMVLIPVQDGMEPGAVCCHLGPNVGIFVGGSTRFKEDTMGMWAAMARAHNAWCHVGRVNSVRRINLCAAAGATSFDGSSVSRYAVTLPKLDNARRQDDLFREGQ